MNTLATIITALSGTGALGGLVAAIIALLKKLGDAATVRAQAKAISDKGHTQTHEQLQEVIGLQKKQLDQQTAFYERVIAEKDAVIKKQDKELTELRKQFMDSLQERIKGA